MPRCRREWSTSSPRLGYIAYTTVQHPVLARKPKRITLSDPVCAPEDLPELVRSFLGR